MNRSYKKLYPALCAVLAVWITVSLTGSMSIAPYYTADPALNNYNGLLRLFIYFSRSLSPDRTLVFALTLLIGMGLYQLPKLHATAKETVLAGIFGALFSLMQMIGRSYVENGSWGALVGSKFVLFRALVFLTGKAIFAACLALCAFRLFDRFRGCDKAVLSKKDFFLAAGLILLCWLPYYLLFYPGMGNPDTGMQIAWALHYPTEWLQYSAVRGPEVYATNHHPYFLTVVFGLFAKLGLALGDISHGVAVYCLLQLTLTAAVMTGVWFYLRFIGLNGRIVKAGLVFTALFPLYPLYAICMLKDPSFTLSSLVLTVLLFEIARSGGSALKNKWFCAAVFVASLLVMLTKNQGVYLVAGAAVLCLIFCRNRIRAIISLLIPVLLFQFLWLQVLLPAWNVAPGGRQEAIGWMFQQTARYVVTYPEDVTEEEADIIRAVIDYDALPELYRPTLADPVKFTFHQDCTDEELSAYYQVWGQMFRRHPDAYVQAILNNVYGSFYLEHYSILTYTGFDNRETAPYPELQIHPSPRVEKIQILLPRIMDFAQLLPGVGLLFSVGFYPWLVLLVFLDALRKKQYALLLPQSLMILSVGVLLLSPANGSFRYAMPFPFIMPFLLSLCLLDEPVKAGFPLKLRRTRK